MSAVKIQGYDVSGIGKWPQASFCLLSSLAALVLAPGDWLSLFSCKVSFTFIWKFAIIYPDFGLWSKKVFQNTNPPHCQEYSTVFLLKLKMAGYNLIRDIHAKPTASVILKVKDWMLSLKMKNKTRMSALTISIQCCTEESSQSNEWNKTR